MISAIFAESVRYRNGAMETFKTPGSAFDL